MRMSFWLSICFSLFVSAVICAGTVSAAVIDDKNTMFGVVKFPLDVSRKQSIVIAKYIKAEFKPDQVLVIETGPSTFGVSIRSKYSGKKGQTRAFLESIKAKVTKKFGPRTIAGWDFSEGIVIIN